MRAKFDEIMNCKDPVEANKMLEDTDKELFRSMHWQPRKCKFIILYKT